MRRDQVAGLDHDALWRGVWAANDREFEEVFAPAEHADVRFRAT